MIFFFIINALVGNGYKVNPILNDNNEFVSLNIVCDIKNIKNLKINRKVIGNRIVINIKDSYLLLGSSLRSLCKVFNTKVKKGIFPYGFVNDKNLNYQGSIPDKKYFERLIDEDELSYEMLSQEYINKNWSLRENAIAYLNNDLKSLKEVLIKFSDIIFNQFSLNITNYNTISGLSLFIYLSNYYDNNYEIPLIRGDIEKEIRKAYYGGIVNLNCNIVNDAYYYDMNSMYF